MPKVSVIMPCYNQGLYIDEAVDSVLTQTFQDFEIIIVNDGSTDSYTNEILKNYNKPKTRVIHTVNQGVSAARNCGIKASCGEYILPLDADDKINNTYLQKAVQILDTNKNIGIVYSEALFFGEKKQKWNLPDYYFNDMLKVNHIFCSAFFRRADYDKTAGYDSNMVHGLEDWDFWLSLIELNVTIYKIPEILFHYRIKKVSKSTVIDNDTFKMKVLNSYVFYKHIHLYSEYSDAITAHFEKKELQKTILQIKNSYTFKIGMFIVKPFSWLKNLWKRSFKS